MKLKAGQVILPYEDDSGDVVGVRVAWTDGINHRKLRKVLSTAYGKATGRPLPSEYAARLTAGMQAWKEEA